MAINKMKTDERKHKHKMILQQNDLLCFFHIGSV